jgi:hypothetical protein
MYFIIIIHSMLFKKYKYYSYQKENMLFIFELCYF